MICSVRYGESGDAWTGGGEAYKVVRRGRFGLDLKPEDWGDFVVKKELVFAGCLQKFFMYGYCDDF